MPLSFSRTSHVREGVLGGLLVLGSWLVGLSAFSPPVTLFPTVGTSRDELEAGYVPFSLAAATTTLVLEVGARGSVFLSDACLYSGRS